MIGQIVAIVFPLFAIVLVGFLYGRRRAPDMEAANRLNLEIFAPALIFHVFVSREFQVVDYGGLALGGALVVLGSGLLAWPVARLFGFRAKTFLPPMMFSNAGNMGLPLALFTFGEQALPAAVVLFMVEASLHFSVGVRMLDSAASLWRLTRMPILVASFLGLAINLSGWHPPALLLTPVEMLGQIAIPLMLFSLGVRLTAIDFGDWRIGLAGALACPAAGVLIALAAQPLLGLGDLQFKQLLLFGALPPAVINFILAEQYRQEPQRVASIVLLGNLASVVVIPITLLFVL